MHELGVTEEVLRLVLQETEKAGASRVTAVGLAIGEFSSVVRESVAFYWEFLSRGTSAEGADLRFETREPLALCGGCGQEYRPLERDHRCPNCGEAVAQLLAGEEFRLDFIEVE